MEKTKTTNNLELIVKKKYISPKVYCTIVEMESGIAASSAKVAPATTNGNANSVQTDWEGNNDTIINTDF